MSKEYSESEVREAVEKIMEKGGPNLNGAGQGMMLFHEDSGMTFQAGSIFEAQTVKGGKNYIVFMCVRNGWVYYCHGDKAKKTQLENFKKLISYGDLYPVPKEKQDIERLALCVLGLKAMVNGLAFNDYLKVCEGYGDGSQVPHEYRA